MISEKRKQFAVIGTTVNHSLSPLIHNTLYDIYGIQAKYTAINIRINQLDEFFNTEAQNLSGFNVTMPFKGDIISFMDWVEPSALRCGAVNTVKRDGNFAGFSTDSMGLNMALRCEGIELNGCCAAVLGAGGAARSIVYGLHNAGAKKVVILNRTRKKAEELCVQIAGEVYEVGDSLEQCDLLINATPSGSISNELLSTLPGHALVCDISYLPSQTELLYRAGNLCLRVMSGIPMLIWQAFYAFDIWFGEMPTKQVYERVYRELGWGYR